SISSSPTRGIVRNDGRNTLTATLGHRGAECAATACQPGIPATERLGGPLNGRCFLERRGQRVSDRGGGNRARDGRYILQMTFKILKAAPRGEDTLQPESGGLLETPLGVSDVAKLSREADLAEA